MLVYQRATEGPYHPPMSDHIEKTIPIEGEFEGFTTIFDGETVAISCWTPSRSLAAMKPVAYVQNSQKNHKKW